MEGERFEEIGSCDYGAGKSKIGKQAEVQRRVDAAVRVRRPSVVIPSCSGEVSFCSIKISS